MLVPQGDPSEPPPDPPKGSAEGPPLEVNDEPPEGLGGLPCPGPPPPPPPPLANNPVGEVGVGIAQLVSPPLTPRVAVVVDPVPPEPIDTGKVPAPAVVT